MRKIKRRGIIAISPEELFQLLGLQNATLLDAKIDYFRGGNLDLVIESPNMPECLEGAFPLTVTLEEVNKCHIR